MIGKNKKNFNILLSPAKENYNRGEAESLLQSAYRMHQAELAEKEKKINELLEQIRYWDVEHEKTLVLMVENTTQKIELEVLNQKLKSAMEQLEIESKTDFLTRLLNRNALYHELEASIKQLSRTKERMVKKFNTLKESNPEALTEEGLFDKDENLGKLACAIIDIDFFKKVNDTYGHLMGDQVLRRVGELLNGASHLRASDFSGRFGGEEFLIIFPETTAEHALIPMTKIAQSIKAETFTADNQNKFSITVSAGIAEYDENDETFNEVIKRADTALYRAKESGRDRIIIFNGEESS